MLAKEVRRQYLAKLNQVVELAIEIAGWEWRYCTATMSKAHEDLTALGRITSLEKAAGVERIGWYISDRGTPIMESVGNALVHVAKHYRSGHPTGEREFEAADERIKHLEELAERKRV